MTSQLRTTAPRDCHSSAQLRPPLKGLPSRATACRYVYTGPGGVSSLAIDPPGTPVAPCRLEVLHLFRWSTHTHTTVVCEATTWMFVPGGFLYMGGIPKNWLGYKKKSTKNYDFLEVPGTPHFRTFPYIIYNMIVIYYMLLTLINHIFHKPLN